VRLDWICWLRLRPNGAFSFELGNKSLSYIRDRKYLDLRDYKLLKFGVSLS
jgi:hypothetical protein